MNAADQTAEYHTIDDIYALPEGKHAELIDGRLYMMSAPNIHHQRLAGHLYRKIADYIDSHSGQCEAFTAPSAVFLNADDKIIPGTGYQRYMRQKQAYRRRLQRRS